MSNLKNKLPKYIAPNNIWDKIEIQLDLLENEQVDKKITSKLPTYRAPDIFENIEPPPKYKLIRLSVIKVAAAAIILLALTFSIDKAKNKANVVISYSTETIADKNTNISINLENNNLEFKEILSQNCLVKPIVCQQPEYSGLMQQLNEIEAESEELKKVFSQYNNPEIESLLVRLANDKIKIENYILNLFS